LQARNAEPRLDWFVSLRDERKRHKDQPAKTRNRNGPRQKERPYRVHLLAFLRSAQYFFILALTACFCAAVIFRTLRATALTCRTL
jgi:hypothetical protein